MPEDWLDKFERDTRRELDDIARRAGGQFTPSESSTPEPEQPTPEPPPEKPAPPPAKDEQPAPEPTPEPAPPVDAPRAPEPPSKKGAKKRWMLSAAAAVLIVIVGGVISAVFQGGGGSSSGGGPAPIAGPSGPSTPGGGGALSGGGGGGDIDAPTGPAIQRGLPIANDPDFARLEFQTLAERQAPVTAAGGGNVALDDGASVTLPPGAISADGVLQLRKLRVAPNLHAMRGQPIIYEITAGEHDTPLNQPATLRLPLPAQLPAGVTPQDLRIVHMLANGESQALSGRVDMNNRTIEVELRSFSWAILARIVIGGIIVMLADDAIEWADPSGHVQRADTVSSLGEKKLAVPYYYQGQSGWCWATSAAMMLRAYGYDASPPSLAALVKAPYDEGGSVYVFEKVQQPTVKSRTIGGASEKTFRGWLINQIQDNRPVWIGLHHLKGFKQGSHVVLVVGHDADGFFVHDPSGSLAVEVLGRQLEPYLHIPWDEWATKVFVPSASVIKPWISPSAVVEASLDPAQPRHVSMQVLSYLIEFRRNIAHPDRKRQKVIYHWNGKAPGGAGFSPMYVHEASRGIEGTLSNSDRLIKFGVTLHNTGPQAFDGTVRCYLNDVPIGEPVAVHLDPKQINHNVALMQPMNAVWPNSDPGAALVGVAQRRDLPLPEALNFLDKPLPMGTYQLHAVLTDTSGAEIERVTIPFRHSPAVVPNVKAERVQLEDGGVFDRVSWDASPSHGRLRQPAYSIFYYKPDTQERPERVFGLAPARQLGPTEALCPLPTGIAELGDEYTYVVIVADASMPPPLQASPLSVPAKVSSIAVRSGGELEVESAPRPGQR